MGSRGMKDFPAFLGKRPSFEVSMDINGNGAILRGGIVVVPPVTNIHTESKVKECPGHLNDFPGIRMPSGACLVLIFTKRPGKIRDRHITSFPPLRAQNNGRRLPAHEVGRKFFKRQIQ